MLILLDKIITIGLVKSGRRFSFTTEIQDKPGGLAELTRILSGLDEVLSQPIYLHQMKLGRLNAHMIMETFIINI